MKHRGERQRMRGYLPRQESLQNRRKSALGQYLRLSRMMPTHPIEEDRRSWRNGLQEWLRCATSASRCRRD